MAGVRILAVLLLLTGAWPSQAADEFVDEPTVATVEQLETLGETDKVAAIARLQALQTKLNASVPPEVHRQLLEALSQLLDETGQLQAADAVVDSLQQFGETHHDQIALAMAGNQRASLIFSGGNPGTALQAILKVLPLAEQAGDLQLLSDVHINTGYFYSQTGDMNAAISHNLQAVTLLEQAGKGSSRQMVQALTALTGSYLTAKDSARALQYLQRARQLSDSIQSFDLSATLENRRGYALADLGKNDEAKAAYLAAVELARRYHVVRIEALALSNLSDHGLVTQHYKEAADWGRQAAIVAEKNGDRRIAATARANVGMALIRLGQVRQGAEQTHQALSVLDEIGAKSTAEQIWGDLAISYNSVGEYKEAYDALMRKYDLSQELFNSERAKEVTALQEQFEAAKRDQQIELLERTNSLQAESLHSKNLQQRIVLLTALVIVLAAVLVFQAYRKMRAANQQLHQANAQLEFLSNRDPLTGLYNRRFFLERMRKRHGQQNRRNTPTMTDGLILLDIDHFKHINDSHGHASGDAVLVEISNRLTGMLRDGDMLVRWGGEEFLIYLRHIASADIGSFLGRVLQTIGTEPVQHDGQSIPVSASAGFISLPFAELTEDRFGWEQAVNTADLALYISKQTGRNRATGLLCINGDPDQVLAVIHDDLHQAIKEGVVQAVTLIGPERRDLAA